MYYYETESFSHNEKEQEDQILFIKWLKVIKLDLIISDPRPHIKPHIHWWTKNKLKGRGVITVRILDVINDRSLKRVMLFLTMDEAKSLYKQLDNLISKPKLHHIHIEDDSFTKELTVAIYTPFNISEFDERSKRLLEKDE